MDEKNEEKYLGDVIYEDWKNLKNIKVRIDKGKGIVENTEHNRRSSICSIKLSSWNLAKK